MPEMVFAPVSFLEFLEMHEGVVPALGKKSLRPRFRLHGSNSTTSAGFQELEKRNCELA